MIIALDPSIANAGWCVMRQPAKRPMNPRDIETLYVESGIWYTEPHNDHAERIGYLAGELTRLCGRHEPTLAVVEKPAIKGVYASRRGRSAKAKEAILGGDLAMMQQVTGAFVAVLASRCRVLFRTPTRPYGLARGGQIKPARRRDVAAYWPHLADVKYDESDAVHLALMTATDDRIRRAA